MTKNKVTAITSEKVGMSTDHSNSVSTEADRLNGKNVESPTTKLLCGRRSRSNSMDASRTTRSTNKVGNGYFDKIFNDKGYKISNSFENVCIPYSFELNSQTKWRPAFLIM